MNATTTTSAPPRDPRVLGGRYRSHYWGTEYTVLAIKFSAHGFLDSITVHDDSGRRTHGTAWDQRDQILFEPQTKAQTS